MSLLRGCSRCSYNPDTGSGDGGNELGLNRTPSKDAPRTSYLAFIGDRAIRSSRYFFVVGGKQKRSRIPQEESWESRVRRT